MTKEQEDKIVAQAQDILERRMAVEKDLKIDLHNLVYYGAYYMGALIAATKLGSYFKHNWRGDDRIYLDAELRLITSSKRNMQLWLDGTQMGFRNHNRNNKGKLESVECYFVEQRNVITEVK
jgi:hypothetical protein